MLDLGYFQVHDTSLYFFSVLKIKCVLTYANLIYKFPCCRWNPAYHGKTCRHLNFRFREHSGVLPLTGKKLKSKTTTAVKDHMLFCDHVVFLEDFKILASSNSEFDFKIKQSLLISRDKPELNGNEKSLPLYLLD